MTQFETEIRQLIESNKNSVVTVASSFAHISEENRASAATFDEFSYNGESYINIGTGIIFDESGYVLTRSSVVLGAESNIVQLATGEELPATFTGHDPETGFAIIKINYNGLTPSKLGNSSNVTAGSLGLILGNSMGVHLSVLFGMVNGIRPDGMIQLSVSLNPGNNGSPLFNIKGKVIGLVAGSIDVQESFSLSSFSQDLHSTSLVYPINWIKKIANDLIQFGYVRKGWLGVVGYHDGWKPKIREIIKNSPAQQAGLVEGDIIAKFASKDVYSMAELVRLVELTPPGQIVTLEYMRSGEIMQANVKIGEKAQSKLSSRASLTEVVAPYNNYQNKDAVLTKLIQASHWYEQRILKLEEELQKLRKKIDSN